MNFCRVCFIYFFALPPRPPGEAALKWPRLNRFAKSFSSFAPRSAFFQNPVLKARPPKRNFLWAVAPRFSKSALLKFSVHNDTWAGGGSSLPGFCQFLPVARPPSGLQAPPRLRPTPRRPRLFCCAAPEHFLSSASPARPNAALPTPPAPSLQPRGPPRSPGLPRRHWICSLAPAAAGSPQ